MRRLIALLALFIAGIAVVQADAGGGLDYRAVLKKLTDTGDAAVSDYRPETGRDTADRFSDLYFDVFEDSGMEQAIGLREPTRKTALEARFAAVIGAAGRGQSVDKVETAWQTLRGGLAAVAIDYGQLAVRGFWPTLVQAFLILLREGFEAILVITALAAYLRKVEAGDKLRVIYYGVGWALVASLVTAWLMAVVLETSGAGREALEGVTMLIAAAVLFYVSYWLISKRESARWQAYVRGRIDKALSRGSLFALGLAAFLAVYREGAETVLFYQALAGQAEGQMSAIASGFALACVALGGVYRGMRSAAFRLPLGLFFGVTAALLYYLAVSFTGNGVLELQEAGWLPITPVAGVPRWPWLGLFPTMEGLLAQALLVAPLLIAAGWWWLHRARVAETRTA